MMNPDAPLRLEPLGTGDGSSLWRLVDRLRDESSEPLDLDELFVARTVGWVSLLMAEERVVGYVVAPPTRDGERLQLRDLRLLGEAGTVGVVAEVLGLLLQRPRHATARGVTPGPGCPREVVAALSVLRGALR
jgi:hypothetical protein